MPKIINPNQIYAYFRSHDSILPYFSHHTREYMTIIRIIYSNNKQNIWESTLLFRIM